VREPEGNRPLGKPRRSWWLILKWILGTRCGGVDWIDLAKDRASWGALVKLVTCVSMRKWRFEDTDMTEQIFRIQLDFVQAMATI
jgi:hypothetical protein